MDTFYEEPENIGKHFGLKIFQNIVTTFEGHFGAESHTDYINRRGDCYYSYNGNEKKILYAWKHSIVLPYL